MPDIFFNNNVYEKDMETTVRNICSLLNKQLFIVKCPNLESVVLPNNQNDYIIAYLYEGNTINEEVLLSDQHELNISGAMIGTNSNYEYPTNTISMAKNYFSINSLDYQLPYYSNESGFLEYLHGNKKYKSEYEDIINKNIAFSKIFKSNELIMFYCYYEYILIECLWAGKTFAEIINDKKLQIIENIPVKHPIDAEYYVYHVLYEQED